MSYMELVLSTLNIIKASYSLCSFFFFFFFFKLKQICITKYYSLSLGVEIFMHFAIPVTRL